MRLLKKIALGSALALAMLATQAQAETVKIGLVVKSLGNGFFEAANKGAQEAARNSVMLRSFIPARHPRRPKVRSK